MEGSPATVPEIRVKLREGGGGPAALQGKALLAHGAPPGLPWAPLPTDLGRSLALCICLPNRATPGNSGIRGSSPPWPPFSLWTPGLGIHSKLSLDLLVPLLPLPAGLELIRV